MESRFTYVPDVNYPGIHEADSVRVIPALEAFKKGYTKPLESHLLNADGLRKYLNSASVTAEIRAEFRFKAKDVEDALATIVRDYSTLESQLNAKELETEATREYYNHFNDSEIDSLKIEYLKFKKTYEYLKEFNNKTRDNWEMIRSVFESVKPNSGNRLVLEQILAFKVYPRIELCELTDLLLRRMAFILSVSKEEEKSGRIHTKAEYHSTIRYGLSALYLEALESLAAPREERRESVVESYREIRDTCIRDPYHLDSRGSEHFNQSYLYTLEMDAQRVEIDRQKLRRAVYIETHLGAEESVLRQDLIRRFISQAARGDRIAEYNEFLFQYFLFVRSTVLLHFSALEDDKQNLFLYHLGPVTFLKMVMHFMREGRTGFIHRRLRKNSMVRELPFEFLKFTLKDWWDESVYRSLNKSLRNAPDEYLAILKLVRNLWREDQAKVLSHLKEDRLMLRAFNIHDLQALAPFLKEQVSYLFYTIFVRFLGPDFVYLPVHHNVSERIS